MGQTVSYALRRLFIKVDIRLFLFIVKPFFGPQGWTVQFRHRFSVLKSFWVQFYLIYLYNKAFFSPFLVHLCGAPQWNTTLKRWARTTWWRTKTLFSWSKSEKGSEVSAWPLHHLVLMASQCITDVSVRTLVSIHIVWLNVKKKYSIKKQIYIS